MSGCAWLGGADQHRSLCSTALASTVLAMVVGGGHGNTDGRVDLRLCPQRACYLIDWKNKADVCEHLPTVMYKTVGEKHDRTQSS